MKSKKFKLAAVFTLAFFLTALSQNKDSLQVRSIYNYYLQQSTCYANLQTLCKTVGGRLSGSPQAAQAVEWAKKAMYAAGADTVILQPCMVRHWVRGKKEICELRGQGKPAQPLRCIALGNSVGTGAKGLQAEVIEVNSFEALQQLGEKNIRGKIVFYNVFFDQTKIRPGNAYGETVKYRGSGASQAAKYGAVATLVRSMSSVADDEPHTGNMNYDTLLCPQKIPALALSYKAADRLHEALAKGKSEVYLEAHCQSLPDVLSYNVVGQITGTEKPNEFLSAGGHLDSWDNGEGAHDDGAGVVQTLELMRFYKTLAIKPKHSIRAVAFMNEENGLAGGKAYAAYALEKKEKHLAALETDAGGYSPRGFNVDTAAGLYRQVLKLKPLLAPYLIENILPGGGGADLSALQKTGVPCMGYEPDTQRYFDIHHTAQDTFDKINKRELELGAAAIGALFYLLDTYYEPPY
jgi:hypothetical protein